MTYRDVLARSERLDAAGQPVWPLAFSDRPRGMSASGQDPQGLEAKPASPTRQGRGLFARLRSAFRSDQSNFDYSYEGKP